jgi:hypothetical protein
VDSSQQARGLGTSLLGAGSGGNDLLVPWRCRPGAVVWYYAACDVPDRRGTTPMTTVYRWTGREAKLLREALRLSVCDFAARLGVGVRTVNKWEARQADITPLPHMQEVLDTALFRASNEVKARFAAATRTYGPNTRPHMHRNCFCEVGCCRSWSTAVWCSSRSTLMP